MQYHKQPRASNSVAKQHFDNTSPQQNMAVTVTEKYSLAEKLVLMENMN